MKADIPQQYGPAAPATLISVGAASCPAAVDPDRLELPTFAL